MSRLSLWACALAVVCLTAGSLADTAASSTIDYDELITALTNNVLATYEKSKTSVGDIATSVSTGAAALGSQLTSGLESFDAKYCTPAAFTPAVAKPASFAGPTFSIEFATGNCTFNETRYVLDGTKQLDCFEPSISYTKTPANFTSKYIKGPTFAAKSCVVDKTFGTPETQTLLVFDGQKNVQSDQLTQIVTDEVQKLLASLSQLGLKL